MARLHARILTTIWTDPDFVSLSSTAQWLYVVILSQPNLSYVGVLSTTVGRWASYSATATAAEVDTALWELNARGYVLHDESTEELLVRTYLKHDGPLFNRRLLNVAIKDFRCVVSGTLREAILNQLPEEDRAALCGTCARAGARAASPARSPSPDNRQQFLSSVVPTQGEGGLNGLDEGILSRTDKALDLLARRDFDAAVARGTTIGARGPYLRRLRAERATVDGPTIAALAAQHPDWNAGVLAGAIDPQRPTVPEYKPDARREEP